MKKLDWIIAAILLLILALGAFYYFFGYKKGRTVAEIFKGSDTTSSGNSTGNSSSNSGTSTGSQALPYGSLPLKKGDKNQLVVLMQRGLNFLDSHDLIVDGNFGPKTEAALEDELGTKVLDLQKAGALYVKVQNWAYAQSPVNTAILLELRALTGQ